MSDSIQINTQFMRLALIEAKKAYSEGEVPVGAVVVQNGKVISSAHNLVETLFDASAHAELLALKAAAEKLGKRRLTDCELYVTLEPCAMCMGAILNFRVGALCFGAFDEAAGCAVSRCELSRLVELRIPFVPGVLEKECAELLASFFKQRRAENSATEQL